MPGVKAINLYTGKDFTAAQAALEAAGRRQTVNIEGPMFSRTH